MILENHVFTVNLNLEILASLLVRSACNIEKIGSTWPGDNHEATEIPCNISLFKIL